MAYRAISVSANLLTAHAVCARKGGTMKRKLILVVAVALLTGCAAPDKMAEQASKDAGQAVAQPLTDLNLVRAEIPAVLAAAAKGPYAAPAEWSCPALAAEVAELDAVLGADLDTPVTATNPSLIERGVGLATDAAVRQVRTVANVVPYRSWVRRLSGAEKYSKEVSAAISAGTIRRAYLKGLGRGENCMHAVLRP
jgi:hypothetical protein